MTQIDEKAEGERTFYEPIRGKLEQLFRQIYTNVYFEITADANFSNRIKSKIDKHRDIAFHFLRRGNSPDILGYVDTANEEYKSKYGYYDGYVVVEIKNEKLALDDIYQTRKYLDLFDAKYAFLVTTEEIPEELKRLANVVYSLLSIPYKKFTLASYKDNDFSEWYPSNPLSEK